MHRRLHGICAPGSRHTAGPQVVVYLHGELVYELCVLDSGRAALLSKKTTATHKSVIANCRHLERRLASSQSRAPGFVCALASWNAIVGH